MVKLTPKKLGKILYEEFDRESWGKIDTASFKYLPTLSDSDSDEGCEDAGLYEVMERVTNRLNKLIEKWDGKDEKEEKAFKNALKLGIE